MVKTAGNHQLKYIGVAAFVVFFWFVYRLGLHRDAPHRYREVLSGNPYVGGEPAHYAGPEGHRGPVHPDVLSEEAATQFCANFRLETMPREEAVKRKVYDLLLINTELEMLDVRLGQMAPSVDYFVILESDRTFTDQAKPQFVQESWDRYEAYHDQMIRRTMDLTTTAFANTWEREGASRNAMFDQVIPFLTGEQAASVDDVLLVSDVDEFFKPETVKALRNCAVPQNVTARSRMFYYSFQWLQDGNWDHPQATLYKGPADTVKPDDLRHRSAEHFVFHEGGWHCSYCFSTLSEIIKKITSFSHTEMDKPEFKDPVKIVNRVRHGVDM